MTDAETVELEQLRAEKQQLYDLLDRYQDSTGVLTPLQGVELLVDDWTKRADAAFKTALDNLDDLHSGKVTLSERDQALYDVVRMLRAYRKSKPLPRRHADGLMPSQREHWGYMRGTESGERAALYSAICRVEAMITDKSLIEPL